MVVESGLKNGRYPLIVKDYPHLLHGGDYNPEQWLDHPGILDEDFRLAGLAGINSLSVGIFSWAQLEPEEGVFHFEWLDDIMNRMAERGMKAVLATPSGAKPNWLAAKYPEIRRMEANGLRQPQGGRHNHCFTSPVYREKVAIINTKLAERYGKHPALGVWHLSNEYSGECHCPLCLAAFRLWLQHKYGTLEKLNAAWWARFWSHTYTDWAQIEQIDGTVHGLALDWKRFVSDQTADFLRHEAAPLRRLTPDTPITTNLMGTFYGLDYRRLAKELDIASWDNYPAYHDREGNIGLAQYISFVHDLNRMLKGGRPFMLMESSPSAVNWMPVNKLLRPGVHRLKSLQAVAHGSDTVQYFQFRKSRGSCEKFHGAVVDHVGHEHTRVFSELARLGSELQTLTPVLGCATPAEVAVIFDWECWWLLEEVSGPRKKMYHDWVVAQYRPFWNLGVAVDVISPDDDLSKYKLVIAPMLYSLKPGVAERLSAFTQDGGTLVGTFLTGITDENDLCHLGGWPGPLRPVFGVWAEEIDYLYDDESNTIVTDASTMLPGLCGEFQVRLACDLIHAEGAEVLATYGQDFYAGRPALTRNRFGSGAAYYLAARTDAEFLQSFYAALTQTLGLRKALESALPAGVTAQLRTSNDEEFLFLLNFSRQAQPVDLGNCGWKTMTGAPAANPADLSANDVHIYRRAR